MSPGSKEAGPSTGPHRIRIASGGSIQGYVKHALQFLQDTPNRPVVLHTMPPEHTHTSVATAKKDVSETEGRKEATTTLLPMTTAIPKLISVVELIKRAYIERINADGGKGKHKAVGIWQYTRSGCVTPSEVADISPASGSAATASVPLSRVLLGKTKPRMTHHPYLEITLSAHPLGLEKERDVTCQYVLAKRRRHKGDAKHVLDDAQTKLEAEQQDMAVEGAEPNDRCAGKGDCTKRGKEKTALHRKPDDLAQFPKNSKHKRKEPGPQDSRTPKRKKLSTSAGGGP